MCATGAIICGAAFANGGGAAADTFQKRHAEPPSGVVHDVDWMRSIWNLLRIAPSAWSEAGRIGRGFREPWVPAADRRLSPLRRRAHCSVGWPVQKYPLPFGVPASRSPTA